MNPADGDVKWGFLRRYVRSFQLFEICTAGQRGDQLVPPFLAMSLLAIVVKRALLGVLDHGRSNPIFPIFEAASEWEELGPIISAVHAGMKNDRRKEIAVETIGLDQLVIRLDTTLHARLDGASRAGVARTPSFVAALDLSPIDRTKKRMLRKFA